MNKFTFLLKHQLKLLWRVLRWFQTSLFLTLPSPSLSDPGDTTTMSSVLGHQSQTQEGRALSVRMGLSPPHLPLCFQALKPGSHRLWCNHRGKGKSLFMVVASHRDWGRQVQSPRTGAHQSSSMGLTWSSEKKGKAGCLCHGDTKGEVSALWPPYTHLLSDSTCALVWNTSLAHAQQFSQAERAAAASAALAWGGVFLSENRAYRLAPEPASPQLSLDTGFCLPVVQTLPCPFWFVFSSSCISYTLCELHYGHCLRFQKPRVCRDGDLVMGGYFPLYELYQESDTFWLSFVGSQKQETNNRQVSSVYMCTWVCVCVSI